MGRRERAKGARGEREAAAALRGIGIAAERAARSGVTDGQDVLHALAGVSIEVKRTETLRLMPALEQAARRHPDAVPLVLWRRNHGPWVVVLPLADLPRLVRSYAGAVGWQLRTGPAPPALAGRIDPHGAGEVVAERRLDGSMCESGCDNASDSR